MASKQKLTSVLLGLSLGISIFACSTTQQSNPIDQNLISANSISQMGFLANKKFTETGMTIVEISNTNRDQVGKLVEMGLDVWMVDNSKKIVRGQVDSELLETIKKMSSVKVKLLSPKEGLSARNTFDPNYHTYEEMLVVLKSYAAKYPNLAKLHDFGDTWEKTKGLGNRDLWMMQITGKGNGSSKPGIAFLGNHHARELATVEIPLKLIKHLLDNYGKDPDVTKLVDTREIWIAPMINPDGHIQAEQGQNWRKNKNKNNQTSLSRTGVDLNRNYGYKWGTGGSSSSISSQTYKGEKAFSEPETQAVRDFMRKHKNLKFMMSYHSFSNLILFPWGYSHSATPDEKLIRTIGNKLGAMSGYEPKSASELYIASGITDDWTYGELGILSYTTEIGSWGDGFDPPYSKVNQFWKENLPGAMYLIELAGNPQSALK